MDLILCLFIRTTYQRYFQYYHSFSHSSTTCSFFGDCRGHDGQILSGTVSLYFSYQTCSGSCPTGLYL